MLSTNGLLFNCDRRRLVLLVTLFWMLLRDVVLVDLCNVVYVIRTQTTGMYYDMQ
jgi:hypothetical protein